jgi:hypothetical protein
MDEFASTMPVRPPIVNRNTNPSAQKEATLYVTQVPYIVASHLKILIPADTAIIIVADVKYAHVSMSIATVNMWYAHTVCGRNNSHFWRGHCSGCGGDTVMGGVSLVSCGLALCR